MCCGKPCVIGTWEAGKFVYKCINCGAVVG